MRRGALGLWLAIGWIGVAQGCSGTSVEIGGDPKAEGGTVNGGTFSGATSTGGAFPSGGVSGTAPVGGTPASGGVFLTGGTSGSANGGTATPGGTGGVSTSGGTSGATGEGGDDGAIDHYPPVLWGDGQGYRSSCPEYDAGWGFTCWNYDGATRSCSPNGTPYCNACSCALPCETAHECPPGVTGAPADCIASATTARSCFLVCDVTMVCPEGMSCLLYPGTERYVCMWVDDERSPE